MYPSGSIVLPHKLEQQTAIIKRRLVVWWIWARVGWVITVWIQWLTALQYSPVLVAHNNLQARSPLNTSEYRPGEMAKPFPSHSCHVQGRWSGVKTCWPYPLFLWPWKFSKQCWEWPWKWHETVTVALLYSIMSSIAYAICRTNIYSKCIVWMGSYCLTSRLDLG